MSDLVIRKATSEDLNDILAFLKQEDDEEETGKGFWCNREPIKKGQKEDNLSVLVRPSDAMVLAFCLWSIQGSMDIMEVRPEFQRKNLHYGTRLAKHVLEELYAQDFIGVLIQCEPTTSLGFWQKMGFQKINSPYNCWDTCAVYLFHKTRKIPNDAETKTVDIHLEDICRTDGCSPKRPFRCQGIIKGTKCTLEKDFIRCPLVWRKDWDCGGWGNYHIHICVEGYQAYSEVVIYSDEVGVKWHDRFVRLRELDLSKLTRQ